MTNEVFNFSVNIITLVSMYFIFQKMGRQGWEGIIPLYNIYVLFEVLYGEGFKSLTLLIPIYNVYVIFRTFIDLAHRFGKNSGFGVGLILLSPVFSAILAFSNDCQFDNGSYVDATATVKETFGKAKDSFDKTFNETFEKQAEKSAENTDGKDPVAELKKYKDLKDSGMITDEEYAEIKKRILKL